LNFIKKILFAFLVLLLTGCQFINIEITGTATGRNGWTVVIKDNQDKIVYGSNVKDGMLTIGGYYPDGGRFTNTFGIN
jgi:hypothetical protein